VVALASIFAAKSTCTAHSRFARRKPQYPGHRTAISGRRFYNPTTSRFINRDPIEEKGGLNLYRFCRNSPVNLWDILGNMTSVSESRTLLDGASLASVQPSSGSGWLWGALAAGAGVDTNEMDSLASQMAIPVAAAVVIIHNSDGSRSVYVVQTDGSIVPADTEISNAVLDAPNSPASDSAGGDASKTDRISTLLQNMRGALSRINKAIESSNGSNPINISSSDLTALALGYAFFADTDLRGLTESQYLWKVLHLDTIFYAHADTQFRLSDGSSRHGGDLNYIYQGLAGAARRESFDTVRNRIVSYNSVRAFGSFASGNISAGLTRLNNISAEISWAQWAYKTVFPTYQKLVGGGHP
jgi:RHS repeat-associated protein